MDRKGTQVVKKYQADYIFWRAAQAGTTASGALAKAQWNPKSRV
jgi:hypothetical protein